MHQIHSENRKKPPFSFSSLVEMLRYRGANQPHDLAFTFRVNGEQAGSGRFERSVPVIFTASETFDIGMDLGSPVSLDYHDRAPFKFNGKIEKINIKYI